MDRESETDGLTGRQMASDRDRLDRENGRDRLRMQDRDRRYRQR